MISFILFSILFLLAACGKEYKETAQDAATIEELTEEFLYILDYTTISVSDEIQLTIAYVTDGLLARHNNFIEFSYRGRSPHEGGIAFIPNVPVRNFRYIRINGAEIQFIVEEDLFLLDELRPEKPLLVDWFAMGSGAYGGFAFDDESGTTRYFGFNYCAAGFTAFRWKEFDGGLSLDGFAPHPFAAALKEYITGYDGTVRAYLATLDDNGTIGVLTTRPSTRFRAWDDYDYKYVYDYGISGTLFYIQDGDLFEIDVSSWWLFVAGRYNRLMNRLYGHTHIVEIIYKLEFGRLETSTRLEYFSDEYLSYLFDGDYDVVAELIAERDARAEYAREKYGLVAQLPPNFGHMRNTEDQTAQILAMTINCVPGACS